MSANFKYNSWGRTRRPKHPLGTDKHTITGSATIGHLQKLDYDEFTVANGCYKTQNQRYVHIATSGSSVVSNMYLYNHAMGHWHELVTGSGDVAYGSVILRPNEHRIIDIQGADFIAITSGSGVQTVTMAFSTF